MLLGPAGLTLFTLLVMLVSAGIVLLTRAAVHSGSWLAAFVYPTLRAAFDTILAVTPSGTAGSLANSQMDAFVVIQIASKSGGSGADRAAVRYGS